VKVILIDNESVQYHTQVAIRLINTNNSI
jgi:hypothetical protein